MQTPLYTAHQKLNARLIDFNGWMMPVQYTAISDEHHAVRAHVGVFDTCHMGEFYLRAPQIRIALNQLLTGDFHQLPVGKMRYSFITNDRGGIIDDVVVFMIDETAAMICVNAGNILTDELALKNNLPAATELTNASEQTAKLDIQGVAAQALIKQWLQIDFCEMPFYSFREVIWQDEKVLLSRSGYTGSPGVEIFAPSAMAELLWDTALKFGAVPCGLGARDTLRLEAALPLYGHELSVDRNPFVAGLGKFVVLNKRENFCGKGSLQEISTAPLAEQLVGLKIADKRIPRAGNHVVNIDNIAVGTITSGAPAWSINSNIAFAYIATTALSAPLFVDIRGRKIAAEKVKIPFYRDDNLRRRI